MKTIILIVAGLLVVYGAVFVKNKDSKDIINNNIATTSAEIKKDTYKDQLNNNEKPIIKDKLGPGEIKIIGSIDNVLNAFPYDGNLVVTVSGKKVIIEEGGLPVVENLNKGQIIGFDQSVLFENYLGLKVEIFASKLKDSNTYTILNDKKYYIKLLK